MFPRNVFFSFLFKEQYYVNTALNFGGHAKHRICTLAFQWLAGQNLTTGQLNTSSGILSPGVVGTQLYWYTSSGVGETIWLLQLYFLTRSPAPHCRIKTAISWFSKSVCYRH